MDAQRVVAERDRDVTVEAGRPAATDAGAAVRPPRPKRRSPWRVLRDTARRSPGLIIGAVFLAILALAAIFAPVLAQHDPLAVNAAHNFQSPSSEHWFGTDELGRDLYARALYGARVSLVTGLAATLLAASIGVPLGLISGYFGRWADALIMRAVDIQIALPGILLALDIIVLTGRGFLSSIIAVGVASIPTFARITRASTLSIK